MAGDTPAQSELGIGIITYNRLAALKECVARVQRFTRATHRMLVADDGSTDGSTEWAREQGLVVITGRRRGGIWNRNRALYYLLERTACDPILLLEDDCWPVEPGWEQAWIAAAARWGHLCHSWADPRFILGGQGTAEDPLRSVGYGSTCVVASREALTAVGYMDTRFQGYGWGHVEWTWRFRRFLAERWREVVDPQGPPACLCLRSGLELAHVGSWFDKEEADRNRPLLEELRGEPIWRPAWRTPEEEAIVREEQAAV